MGRAPHIARGARGSSPDGGGGARLPAEQQAAFEAAVLLHLDAAYTLARYLTRHADAAEDIVQEALMRAYRSFGSQRVDNVRAWLLAIVRNCFLSWNAQERVPSQERHFEGDHEHLGALDEEGQEPETPESILLQREESRAIRAAIEELPQFFREVLVLRDIEDTSYREIADVTGVPIGTVMSRLARARKMFAEAWKASEMKSSKELQR